MGQISTYGNASTPTIDDKVIGTDIENENVTKNFEVSQILSLLNKAVVVLPIYTDNTSALAGGLVAGNLYRTAGVAGSSSVVCVVY
jgi:hypothetical protein